MLLFTDGLQNHGAETAEDVLPDLIAAGVRCYTVGFGNDQDAVLLANVAATTGGSYFAIDGDLDPDEAATAISEALIQIAGESRENGGIVSFQDVDGASAASNIPPDDAARPPFLWAPEGEHPEPSPTLPPIDGFRFPVTISAGSKHCTLGVLWKQAKRQFRVRVYSPGGQAVSAGPGVRWVRGKYPYSFCEIDNPKAGVWQVEVVGAGIRNARFRTIGFEVNDRVRFEVSTVASHLRAGGEVRLRARLLMPQAVPGARISGWMRNPNGRWKRFHFTEHTGGAGDREEAFLYTAVVPTEPRLRGQYLVAVDAARAAGAFKIKLDELYSRKPGLKPSDTTRTIKVPRVRRRMLLAVTADPEGPSASEPRAGSNPKDPWVPKNQRKLLERWRQSHSR